MVQIAVFGGPPDSVAEAFRLLQQNKVVALLRLDFSTVLVLPLYYLLFLGFFAALKNRNRTHAAIATALIFIGVTLVLAMPTALPLMALSDKYAAAASDATKAHFLAAGEAILATDIWHGTGAYMGDSSANRSRVDFDCDVAWGFQQGDSLFRHHHART